MNRSHSNSVGTAIIDATLEQKCTIAQGQIAAWVMPGGQRSQNGTEWYLLAIEILSGTVQ